MADDEDDVFTLDWRDIAEGCLMHDSPHALAAWADLRRWVPEQREGE